MDRRNGTIYENVCLLQIIPVLTLDEGKLFPNLTGSTRGCVQMFPAPTL